MEMHLRKFQRIPTKFDRGKSKNIDFVLQKITQNGGRYMLLEFKTKNYKCFVEEACFSMTAAPKRKGLDYSLMKVKTKGSKETKVLSSSVTVWTERCR